MNGTESLSSRRTWTICRFLSREEINAAAIVDRQVRVELAAIAYHVFKLKVNFEIFIADRKATTCIQAKPFLLRCVNPAVLPLVRCYSIRTP